MLFGKYTGDNVGNQINLLKSHIIERDNIGLELINLLDDSNATDVIDEIHRQAEEQLYKALLSSSGTYLPETEVVFISLVLIAMMYYDGSFYEHVSSVYTLLYEKFSSQKIEGLIRTILSRYRTKDEIKCNSRIINTVLMNAIVPRAFLPSFFDFVYDIYKLNLEYSISDDKYELYDDFKFIYDGLRSNMILDDDNIQINVTKKSYKLIKSTKQLIINPNNTDEVIKLSIKVAEIIDKKIWGKHFIVDNPYLKYGYEKWASNIKEKKNKNALYKSADFRSRWIPKYNLTNNIVSIIPPIHRIKGNYDYRDIYVTGINEVLEKLTQEKAGMLSLSKEIFENAEYLYSTGDKSGNPNVEIWDYFYVPIKIGEETSGVRVAVRKMKTVDTGQIYNWGIKKDTSLDGGSPTPEGRKTAGISSDVSANNIPQNGSGVNSRDGEKPGTVSAEEMYGLRPKAESKPGEITDADVAKPVDFKSMYGVDPDTQRKNGKGLSFEEWAESTKKPEQNKKAAEAVDKSSYVNTDPTGKTPEQIKILEEFKNAVSPDIAQFVNEAKKNPEEHWKKKDIGDVSERAANDIKSEIGVDVKGFKHSIDTDFVAHVEARHGINGSNDHSMANVNDIARVGYVIDNYDSISKGAVSRKFKNGDGSHAKTIVYEKAVDGSFYVVEAVPDSKAKKLHLVSAYITKKTPSAQVAYAVNDLLPTSETSLHTDEVKGDVPSPETNIPQNGNGVNSENRVNFEKAVEEAKKNAVTDEELKKKPETERQKILERRIQKAAIDMGADELVDFAQAMGHIKGFFGSEMKDFARIFDDVASSKPMRNKLHELFEKPHREAQAQYTQNYKNAVKDLSEKFSELGIKAGTKESSAVQRIGEGVYQTDSKGTTAPYTIEMLKRDFPQSWQNIEAAAELAANVEAFSEAQQRWNALLKESVEAKKAAEGTEKGGVQFSIRNIVGESGKNYGSGVYLDSNLLENLSDSERVEMVKMRIGELGGQTFTAYDGNTPVEIKIESSKTRFTNKKGRFVRVNNDLTTKNSSSRIKQETVVLADELILSSAHKKYTPAHYPHGWLDNKGQNEWERRTVFVQEKNNSVWKATLHIANAKNGEKILYDIAPIKIVERRGESRTNTTNDNILSSGEKVNTQFSKRTEKLAQLDSEGRKLSEQQQEFFKDSKVRDEEGRLLTVYHGSDSEFFVFDRTKTRANMDIQGSFFSPWEIDAQGYGGKVGNTI